MAELEHLMEQSHKGPGIIVLTGPGGIGKTKLLRAMKAKAAEMNFRYHHKNDQCGDLLTSGFCANW